MQISDVSLYAYVWWGVLSRLATRKHKRTRTVHRFSFPVNIHGQSKPRTYTPMYTPIDDSFRERVAQSHHVVVSLQHLAPSVSHVGHVLVAPFVLAFFTLRSTANTLYRVAIGDGFEIFTIEEPSMWNGHRRCIALHGGAHLADLLVAQVVWVVLTVALGAASAWYIVTHLTATHPVTLLLLATSVFVGCLSVRCTVRFWRRSREFKAALLDS